MAVEHLKEIRSSCRKARDKADKLDKRLEELDALHTKALATVDSLEKEIEKTATELTGLFVMEETELKELSLANTA